MNNGAIYIGGPMHGQCKALKRGQTQDQLMELQEWNLLEQQCRPCAVRHTYYKIVDPDGGQVMVHESLHDQYVTMIDTIDAVGTMARRLGIDVLVHVALPMHKTESETVH